MGFKNGILAKLAKISIAAVKDERILVSCIRVSGGIARGMGQRGP
jgi:hypothetical protein